MKRGLVSEYITRREKNVAEKCSYLMEEKYGANRACHPCVGDREIWERACGGPSKKRRVFGFGSPMDIDLAFTATSSTPTTCSSSTRYSGIASSEEVEKVAQERERVAKELQVAVEERKRVVEQRLKELKEQVKDIANTLKTLIPPRSSPPS